MHQMKLGISQHFFVISIRQLMKSNCAFYALEALLREPLLSLQSLDSSLLSFLAER